MNFMVDRRKFLVWVLVVITGWPLAAGQVLAASISAPATSASGSFTVSWTAGYELQLADVHWRVAGPPLSALSFSDLPAGAYRFVLASCAWTYSWEIGYLYACEAIPSSARTVAVTGPENAVVEAWTAEAGNAPYQAGVSHRGAAVVNVPLRTPPGVNGVSLDLALAYDSARGGDRPRYLADDLLGYGWSLQGVPYIHRCRAGQTGDTELVGLTDSDLLCLEGEPLRLVAGTHWRGEAEYRAASNPDLRITLRSTPETGRWFEMRYPDGAVGRFGDTTGSRVAASGRIDFLSQTVAANDTYIWGLRRLTGALGDELTVRYQRFDGYGNLQPESIAYGGAEVRFSYGPRTDLAPVTLHWPVQVRRLSVLKAVRVSMNGKPVREYRLASSPDQGARLRLDRIQECGYDTSGTGASCLAPLQVQWTTVAGGAWNHPIAVSGLVDGLGARTGFGYTAVTAASNPIGYQEAPFGALLSVPESVATDTAAVSEFRLSDGKTAGGIRRWSYRYKGHPQRSSRNRGYVGFAEVRSKDEQSGIVTYTQTRLDWPFIGSISQTRSLNAAFGSHTRELAREEHAYAQKAHANGARHAYRARSTRWVLEGTGVVGGTIENVSFCYRVLSGGACPATGPEQDAATQRRVVTTDGNALSSPGFTPAYWGDVPVRAISGLHERRSVVRVEDLGNTVVPWVRGAVTRRTVTHAVPGQSGRSVTETVGYLPGSTVVQSVTRFPGDARLERALHRTFDSAAGNALSAETVQGAGLAPRTWRFATPYQDGRYVARSTNPLDQTSSRIMDDRFGQPAELMNPDGRRTTFDYDPFGRVVRESRADGAEITIAYERCDQADCGSVVDAEAALKATITSRNGAVQTAPTRVTYLDVLGRTVLEEVEGLDSGAGWRSRRTGYDNRNRVQYVSRPSIGGAAPVCTAAGRDCTWFTYDIRDRVVTETRPDGGVTTASYSGTAGRVAFSMSETVRTAGLGNTSRTTRSTFDVLGYLTETTDAFGSGTAPVTTYTRDAHGNLAGVAVGGVAVVTLEHDLAGNRTRMIDASSGTTGFAFNALGELLGTTDAKGQATSYVYDALGRLVRRLDPGGVIHAWTWDPVGATGQLAARSRPGFAESYSYGPDHGRLARVDSQVNVTGAWSGAQSREFGYDAAGRLASQRYPNGQTVTYGYANSGYLDRVLSGGKVLHDWRATDGFGNATDERFNDGALRTTRTHDVTTGRLTRIQTGTTAALRSLQDLETVWRTDGALYRRVDRRNTVTTGDDYVDTFAYDAMARVLRQTTTTGASRALNFTYGSNGNLTGKTSSLPGDLGSTGYVYGSGAGPYRLTGVSINGIANILTYDANGNIVRYAPSQGPQTWLRYDARNNVTRITTGPDENTAQARDEFWYDPDGRRFLSRETWNDGSTERARLVLYLGGDYEEVRAPAGAAHDIVQRVQVTPVVRQIRRRDASTQSWEVYHEYVHRDHLGSVDVVSDGSGAVVTRASFDPFGTRRATNRAGDLAGADLDAMLAQEDGLGSRGFTDHEHRNRTGFIHMNGRVYDPRIGRFVSPDPMVQTPTSSESYNRYAYVFNSPLSYTDPSGFCGTQEGFQLTPCKPPYDERVEVFGSGPGSGFFGVLNPGGGGILSHGPGAPGGSGGPFQLPDLATLLAGLQERQPVDPAKAEDGERPLEIVSVVADRMDGPDHGDRAGGWLSRGLANLDRTGIRSLFGSACVGAILGGCGAAAVQTSNGSVHLMLMIGVIPGAGFSFGTEGLLFSSEFQASSGYGTAVLVSGGAAGIGGSLGLAQGTNGFHVTGAAGYGFGLGGGVGFYYAAPVGSISR